MRPGGSCGSSTMSQSQPHRNVTQLLVRWGTGDNEALNELIPIVYAELRKLAISSGRDREFIGVLEIPQTPQSFCRASRRQARDHCSCEWRHFGTPDQLVTSLIRAPLVGLHTRCLCVDVP
jgi:hypothetical protein